MTDNRSIPEATDSDDKRSLPLIVAERWGFPLQYHTIDEVQYYSVLDWIRGVAQDNTPKATSDRWTAMKRRFKQIGNETPTWCRSLPYKAADNKNYRRDYTDAQGLYSITQRLDVNTGLRNIILEFLAKSGVFVDLMRRDTQARAEFGATAGAEVIIEATIGNYRGSG